MPHPRQMEAATIGRQAGGIACAGCAGTAEALVPDVASFTDKASRCGGLGAVDDRFRGERGGDLQEELVCRGASQKDLSNEVGQRLPSLATAARAAAAARGAAAVVLATASGTPKSTDPVREGAGEEVFDILPEVARIRRRARAKAMVRWIGVVPICIGTSLMASWVFCHAHALSWPFFFFAYADVLSCVCTAVLVVILLLKSSTPATRSALGYTAVQWFITLCGVGVTSFCGHQVWFLFYACRMVLIAVSALWALELVLLRLQALELSMCHNFGAKSLWRLWYCEIVIGIITAWCYAGHVLVDSPFMKKVVLILLLVSSVLWQALSMIMAWRFLFPLRCLREIAAAAVGHPKVELECRKAIREARGHKFGVLLNCFATQLVLVCAMMFTFISRNHDICVEDTPLNIFLSQGPLLVHGFANLLLVWTLTGLRDLLDARVDDSHVISELVRRAKRHTAVRAWQPCPDLRWQLKVEELAGRGISLRAVMDFYKGLGRQYMKQFRPDGHTTKDVVREAIIPLTCEAMSSYAEQVMGGAVRPRRLVTHHWDNLFLRLCSGIFAEALQETTYAMAAYLLEHHAEALEQKLADEGVLDETVWVCAFSVNQHASICSSFGRGPPPACEYQESASAREEREEWERQRLDSVTRKPHPLCTCSCPKNLNNSGPLRADGHSIPCEMNKFDEVMAFLASQDPRFVQIVVVDASFDVFSRAWCVAELAEAYCKGIPQNLVLLSPETLEENEAKLVGLHVEDMRASRREDVELILSRIADKRSFNEQLQKLFFDRNVGLLAGWRGLDDLQRLRKVGRLARWRQYGVAADARKGCGILLKRACAAGEEQA